jgi:DNA-binding XRE family transcriptional regulator
MEIMKERRGALNLTQKQAAELCGISRFYYIDLELGRKVPTVKTAKKVAATLGFDWIKFHEDGD